MAIRIHQPSAFSLTRINRNSKLKIYNSYHYTHNFSAKRLITWVITKLFGILTLLFFLFIFRPQASAEGFMGSAELQYRVTEAVTDEQKDLNNQFRQNYYLVLKNTITPILSYGLYLRTAITNDTDTNILQITKERSQRDVEPMIELLFQNPIYSLNLGYRHQERLNEERPAGGSNKLTIGYFYSRFDIKPLGLPGLSLQYDRKKEDILLKVDSNKAGAGRLSQDSLITTYSATSSYRLTYKDINADYNLRYSRKVNETPLNVVNKNTDELLSGQYSLRYSKSFWSGRLKVTSSYRGDYNQAIKELFSTTGGTVMTEQTPLQGLSAAGTSGLPNVGSLDIDETLKDDIRHIPAATPLNLGTTELLNIGIQLFSSVQPVSRLFIYVNEDVRTDSSLTAPANWKLYISSDNINWTPALESIQSVTVSSFDTLHNIYRYELVFSPIQSSYYKVLNLQTVNVSRPTNVFVTEVEAYGTEEIPVESSLTKQGVSFNQGLTFNAGLRLLPRLGLSLNYNISRHDNNPSSILDAAGGLFQNIFSRAMSDTQAGHNIDVSRTYNFTADWKTHRLLTTVLRIQRTEYLNNKETSDVSSNNYSLSFSSAPLPTLDLNLTFSRTDYLKMQKNSTSNSAKFSIGARLYKDVTMVMDAGYMQTESATAGHNAPSLFLSTNLQARLTPKLSGDLLYRYNSSNTGPSAFDSHDGHITVTYRPSRLVNMSGTLKLLTANKGRTLQGSFSLDWRPVRALSLSGRLEQSTRNPRPLDILRVNLSLTWHIFRFMDALLYYNYQISKEPAHKTVYTSIGGRLNCSLD